MDSKAKPEGAHPEAQHEADGALAVAMIVARPALADAVKVIAEGGKEDEEVEAETDVPPHDRAQRLSDVRVGTPLLLVKGGHEPPLHVEGEGPVYDGETDVGQAEDHQVPADVFVLGFEAVGDRRRTARYHEAMTTHVTMTKEPKGLCTMGAQQSEMALQQSSQAVPQPLQQLLQAFETSWQQTHGALQIPPHNWKM
eukprot:CAMPEP_0175186384 /NCGR_PEP_ID=MMETSP0093-20121207/2364_1 /TAXON_ID=311494 /ORGANISM="Alexandrium monilatum, Strain CCMP3105" /LENGTH=196 /DNA_ID=CAMNT_0016479105 /DNA_START=154 /DNA_END=746 /DNA_ORIENTATION=-